MSEQDKINKTIRDIFACVSGLPYHTSISILTTNMMGVFAQGAAEGVWTTEEIVEILKRLGEEVGEILSGFNKLDLPFEMNQ